MKLAVLCPSEIAYRRFMPALAQVPAFEFVGLAVATAEESCVGVPGAVPDGKDEWVAAQAQKANDFVRDYRFKAAAEAIKAGEKSLSDIAEQCGFGSYSYFSKAFKKHFGVSPKEYRTKD